MSSHSLKLPLPSSTTTGPADGEKTRMSTPDSGGGGYFTLSESEAGSTDEIRYNKDFNRSPRKFCRKIFGGLRSRSQTPPRPSPPKEYKREDTPPRPSPPKLAQKSQTPERRSLIDEPLPPKPPPPLSYTSTLPPPVPKKITSKNYRYRSKTLPTRKGSISKENSQAKETSQHVGSAESLLPQSSSEEFLHSSSPPQSSDEECIKKTNTHNTQKIEEGNDNQTKKHTTQLPQDMKHKDNQNMSIPLRTSTFSTTSTPDKVIRKSPLNTSKNKQESVFLTTFRNASQQAATNSLMEIGQMDEPESIKKKITERTLTDENMHIDLAKSDAEIDNEATHIDSQSKQQNKSQIFDKTNNETTKNNVCVEISSRGKLNDKSKVSIASESLAERALHSSQEQLQKLKSYVSQEEIAKYKELGLQAFDLKRESPHKMKESSSVSRSLSCSSVSSSRSLRSALSMSDKTQSTKEKKVKGRGSFSKLFPAKSFSNLIKRSEKKKKKAKIGPLTDDKSPNEETDKTLTRTCQPSPTPSLESNMSMTLTENSSLSPSTLAAVSEITSERSFDCWVPSPVQQSNMVELDKYVEDMMASMKDIRTPSHSPDISSKDLVDMISIESSKTTCEETKSSLQSIIDHIKLLKPACENSLKLQTYSVVMYAGSYCCTPPIEDEIASDCNLEECETERQVAEISEVPESCLVNPADIELNCTTTIVQLRKNINSDKIANRTKSTSDKFSGKLGMLDKVQDNQPIPSPRIKRKIKKGDSSLEMPAQMTVSEKDEQKYVKVSDTSITSFNDLITDLLVPNVDLDNKSDTLNKQENNPTEDKKEVQDERNGKDKITLIKLDGTGEKENIEANFKKEKSPNMIKDQLNDRKKFRMLSDQFKIEIGILKSQYEEHAEEKMKWAETENSLLTTQKNLEKMLKEKNHQVKSLNEKLDIQQALITDKDKRIIRLQEVEKANEALSETNNKMKTELQNEIQELKEIKNDINRLLNINKSLNEQECENRNENIGQQIEFKEKECRLIKENKKNISTEENKESGFMAKNASIIKDLHDKDELITKLKINLKKRGMLLKETQSNIDNDELKSLKEKVDIQNVMITDKDKRIKGLQDGIAEVELGNVKLHEINDNMKVRLHNEIEELKKIKTELASKLDIKQDLDDKDFKKQAGMLKENTHLEITNLKEELARGYKEKTRLLEENQYIQKNALTLKDLQSKDDMITKLKIDLKKRGVLLKDAQTYIDLLQKQSNNHTLKQLNTQIENLESDKNTLIRQKKNIEYELEEVKTIVDTLGKKNTELEDKYRIVLKENSSLSDQVLENEEEIKEIMKKYKSSVTSITTDQVTLQAQAMTIIEYEQENVNLRETNTSLVNKIEELKATKEIPVNKNHLQMKVSELEHKLELEKSTRSRMEMQISRLRETVEKIDKESEELRSKSQAEQEKQRKLFNQLKDLKEDYMSLQRKEANVSQMMNLLENKLLISGSENIILKKELEMALGRIDDFQNAIHSEISSETDTVHCSDEDSATILEVHVSNTKNAEEIHDKDNKKKDY